MYEADLAYTTRYEGANIQARSTALYRCPYLDLRRGPGAAERDAETKEHFGIEHMETLELHWSKVVTASSVHNSFSNFVFLTWQCAFSGPNTTLR